MDNSKYGKAARLFHKLVMEDYQNSKMITKG
jgi:hypothetical protein